MQDTWDFQHRCLWTLIFFQRRFAGFDWVTKSDGRVAMSYSCKVKHGMTLKMEMRKITYPTQQISRSKSRGFGERTY